MGIYRDKLSAIVVGDNFLPIIAIAQNSLNLSITDIAFVIYFVIADKLSRCVTDSGTGNTISYLVAKCECPTGIKMTSSQLDLEIRFYLAWQVTDFLLAAA